MTSEELRQIIVHREGVEIEYKSSKGGLPGSMWETVSVEQFYNGKQSVCRNPQLQKMFVLLGIGEKAGSGADVILQGWDDNKWEHPVIEEKIRPDRVVMTLSLEAMLTDINRQQPNKKRTTTDHKF